MHVYILEFGKEHLQIMWNAVWMGARWKQGYVIPPPPYSIVLASSVKTKEIKVIEFHRILVDRQIINKIVLFY